MTFRLEIYKNGNEMNIAIVEKTAQWVTKFQELIGTYINSPKNSGKICATLINSDGKGEMYTLYYESGENEWIHVRPLCLAKNPMTGYLTFEYLFGLKNREVLKFDFRSE